MQLYSMNRIQRVVIDEAHCLSQWGHYFRPSYLRLKTIIDVIEPKAILAMTATAGPRVMDDICKVLGITNTSNQGTNIGADDDDGVKVLGRTRRNIHVQCNFVTSQSERIKLVSVT